MWRSEAMAGTKGQGDETGAWEGPGRGAVAAEQGLGQRGPGVVGLG